MGDLQLGGTRLEERAAQAFSHESLGAFNLGAARKQLAQLLDAIGRTAEFSTYTKHDISHIDALLASADWIIPDETWKHLTIADALIIVLSIYVHDLGMLVTKEEYAKRALSGFPAFREGILGDDSPRGVDFRDRLEALDAEDREHFIYEEFVRVHHAERIESWIQGKSIERFGVAEAAAALVQETLSSLPNVLRNDVALVARSHHLDNLDDLSIYRTNRAYGQDREEEANLQFAAIVLRTVDLIHITKDRTPTIQYRLASPTDPLGQREWRKQAAVRVVKAKPAVGDDPASIEVHASFEEPEGYFALLSYLDYCDIQLRLSAEWVKQAAHAEAAAAHYLFPWSRIDRDQIDTIGFVRKQFTFSFDQEKVLELLTGHTLYNDASVAIRELSQNAIDAVRLQKTIDPSASSEPQVDIDYDPLNRILRIRDGGVGMTQRVLEDHFLRVGSSSYQSKEFKEQHPNFASISRFGIGVLSAFMIADEVQVATKARDEPTGLQLVLNSVHGRYLIRDLDNASDPAQRLGLHGTEIELKLRASSSFEGSIVDLLRRWLVLPRCVVRCTVGNDSPVDIGWSSPAEALTGLLSMTVTSTDELRVISKSHGATNIAIAERWNPYFNEWEAIHLGDGSARGIARVARSGASDEAQPLPLAGVCIQGIRVTETLPGWYDSPVMLVDVSGNDAPRTNVARTDLEAGPQVDSLIDSIYRALLESIDDQIAVITERSSQRLALKEARELYRQVTAQQGGRGVLYSKPKAMERVLSTFAVHPVEVGATLQRLPAEGLRASGFSVLIGPAADDAARFLDWLPKPKGMLGLLREGGFLSDATETALPLLGGQDALFAYDQLLWATFEVTSVRALEEGRGLLLDFANKTERWRQDAFGREFVTKARALLEASERFAYRSDDHSSMYCMESGVTFENLPEEAQVVFVGKYRLFGPKSPFTELWARAQSNDDVVAAAALFVITKRVSPYRSKRSDSEGDSNLAKIEEWLDANPPKSDSMMSDLKDLAKSAPSTPVWSPWIAWRRREEDSNL